MSETIRQMYRRKFPRSSGYCAGYQHKECKGWRQVVGGRTQCECYCHAGVCPCCGQPKDGVAKSRLLTASLRLQQMAKELTNGVSQ